MTVFIATMSYELSPDTPRDAQRLLVAELVGRRWQDKSIGAKMPAGTVWARKSAEPGHTTDDVHEACGRDLFAAVAAVAATGRPIRLVRAWVQVSGAGTYGLLPVASAPSAAPDPAR
ncbi:MAG: hypothetical protein U0359_27135 [Byssovorax sp.]